MTKFVHLRVHSEFSIVDGIVRIPELVRAVADDGMAAVALTDWGNLFGLVKFYNACVKAGIKPIVGVDCVVGHPGDPPDRGYPVTLLAQNGAGYRNLLRLVSAMYVGCGRRGQLDFARLTECGDGLLVLSGGMRGDIGSLLLQGDDAAAVARLARWRSAFGDRYYLELQRTGRTGEDAYVSRAVELAHKERVPVVATNDVRFLSRDDFEAHETRVCVQQSRVLDDPRRPRDYSEEQYLKSAAEMVDRFADLPEAIENAVNIARRCSAPLRLGEYFLPNYPVPPGTTLEAFLQARSHEGLSTRLAAVGSNATEPRHVYDARLDFELGVINQMGYAGYFLIVMEFIEWARNNAIPVGPGRGSGAGSLVAYALGITDLDPIEYDLLFERFLNPERVSMPDFDVDFCMEGRDRVISHVSELYGEDAVSQIITFGTMAAKAVVRDVARVQGKPYGLADKLSKLIPFEVGMTLTKAVEESKELAEFIRDDEDVGEIMDMAYKLEGIVRNVGKHAGGVVIAPSALTDFVPLYVDEQSAGLVAQFDKDDVETAGLVKFDFLGLKTLTIIDWAVKAINATEPAYRDEPLDVDRLDLSDPGVYELLKRADTTGVFQLESRGMKDLMRRLGPDSMDDIIALVALFRPGPLQSGAVDDYIDRKHGRAPVEYPHPELEPVLQNTYGVVLFQEQVMQIAQVLAGFSLGQADLLRRAMGKKKPEEMARVREQFLAGTNERGVDPGLSGDIFDLMEKFAGYAFNKSHSAGYALLSFQTAWLKRYFPAQFMAANLSADMQNIDRVVALVDDVRTSGVAVLPPDVCASDYRFSAQDGAVRYGLGAIRGVGEGPVRAIVEERAIRPFADFDDFCMRLAAHKVNRRVLEALIRAGALDRLAGGVAGGADSAEDIVRAKLLAHVEGALRAAEQSARNNALGITDMFADESPAAQPTPAVPRPLRRRDRLAQEKEVLGLYLSGHPIDDYKEEISHLARVAIARLSAGRQPQSLMGLVVSQRSMRSKRGLIGFVTLDDGTGRIEVSLFNEEYDRYRHKLVPDTLILVEGVASDDAFTDGLKFRAKSVMTLEEARQARSGQIEIACDSSDNRLNERLRSCLGPFRAPDACVVALRYHSGCAQTRLVLSEAWSVRPTDDLLHALRTEFGADRVVLQYPGG